MTPRRFSPPWSVEELDACFVVRRCYAKNKPTEFCVGGLLVAAQTTFVLWCRSSCKDYCRAAPHVASRERCAEPHVARGERCAAPHVARGDRRAALDAGSYRTFLERLKRTVPEQMALERMVLEQSAVPEPQHLTSLARWSAGSPTRRLGREGKTRLGAKSFFQSRLISGLSSPETLITGPAT
jgi:hypothetical protein